LDRAKNGTDFERARRVERKREKERERERERRLLVIGTLRDDSPSFFTSS
jgi:hypothetical protein